VIVSAIVMSSFGRRLACAWALIVLCSTSAVAQTQVRVTSDHTTVWRDNFRGIATVVNAGTVLDVVAQRGTWFLVVLPTSELQQPMNGLIAASRVQVINGPSDVPRDPRTTERRPPQAQRPRTSPASRAPVAPPPEVDLFAQFGYGSFTAMETFQAILGHERAAWYGGGLQYRLRSGLFVEGAIEYFRGSGERVFVFNDQVFRLGIKDTVSITPFMATVGYRFGRGRTRPYVGAGIGAYRLRESSEFADSDDEVRQTSGAYRAVAGVQREIGRKYGIGMELQYTTVPKALSGGIAEGFDESNLGGFQVRARVLFGN
jgi:opacity protein-like surface antigen